MTNAIAQQLEKSDFRGEVVIPTDARYDELRQVWNAMVDAYPLAIVRCTSAADVAAAIGCARDTRLPLSVRGGGHSVAGHAVCDGGVMIDLRPMNAIEVDPETRTCRAQPGLIWGEFDAATQEHGLAVTGGRMSTTGIAGLTLGGGSGWVERKLGYAADSLLSVEIVTADGAVLTASESENPDLFWGVRGGGGNFGVVTSFEFRLHPLGPMVLGGLLLYPAEMAADVLRNYREVMADAPDGVGGAVDLASAPPEEFVPEALRGRPVAGVAVVYAGPVEEGEEALRPLREFGPPALELVEPMPYTAFQRLVIDPGSPPGQRNYFTSDYLSGLPDEAIEVVCHHHLTRTSPLSEIAILPGGGAAARCADDALGAVQRRAPFNYIVHTKWADDEEDALHIGWSRGVRAALEPFATGGVYLNFIGEEGEDRVRSAYGPEAYARLQALKDRHDPENLFRRNQNIRPSRALVSS
jgi:FAD/FMN-containing dehydrogenase